MATAEPDVAPIFAVPDVPLPANVTRARPFSVRASRGSITPTVDVKYTIVPFCTGVPADSVTVAVISALPVTGRTVWLVVKVMDESVGAVRSTLSHALRNNDPRRGSATSVTRRRRASGDSMVALG